MSFLTAEWRKLAIVNYEVQKELLVDYLPSGTELDLWNGKCFVSVIGFMFVNTRLLGIKIPFHSEFEEVNLRFYVKRFENGEWKRGVVFIKEIVPKLALSFVANWVYKEHYETAEMNHVWETKDGKQNISYQWKNKKSNESWNRISLVTEDDCEAIEEGSFMEFITEHYWGYTRINARQTNEYEVRHPRWLKYKILESQIDIDFSESYGLHFSFLNSRVPDSVMLAEGSEVSVEPKQKLKSRNGFP